MELTNKQIELIQHEVQGSGVELPDLIDSLVDHICCSIENSGSDNFEEAYNEAIAEFGERGMATIQKETTYLLTIKQQIIMKKTMFVLGYIAAFLITTGMLFKTMHWPGANISLVSGIFLLNVGFLPLYFYDRYKKSIEA